MKPTARLGFLLGLCLPAAALAQDGFPGQYELEGRYSNRRKTCVELRVTQLPGAGLVVERTARFTSGASSGQPAFTWSSGAVEVDGRRMRVTYTVDVAGSAGSAGLVAGLDPDSASREAVVSALTKTNVLQAVYFLSADKRTLREIVVNTTRLGDQRTWLWISCDGARRAAPGVQPLSRADYERIRDDVIRDWYLGHVREHYEDALAEPGLSAAERRRLERSRDADLDVSSTEIMDDDEWFADAIDDRYSAGGEPFRDAFGRAIPKAALESVSLSFFPEYAGIGLSKAFLFDTRTGELIDSGEIMD